MEPAEIDPLKPPEPPRRSTARTILTWAIKLGLVAGIFAWLIYKKSIKASDLTNLAANWPWALVTLGLYGVSALICTLRHKLLLKTLSVEITYLALLPISLIGLCFDLIAPMNGGDLVKAYYVNRAAGFKNNKRDIGLVLLSSLLDRIMGFLGLFMLGLIVSAIAWSEIRELEALRHMVMFMAALCACVFAGFLLMVSERLEASEWRKRLMHRLPLHERIESIYAGFAGMRHHKRIVAGLVALSIVNHMFVCLMVLLMAHGMEFKSVATGEVVPLPVVQFISVLPICLTLNSFGFAGGFGVGNFAFKEIFERVLGITGGAALILAPQIVGVIFRLLGIPFVLFYKHRDNTGQPPVSTDGQTHQ